MYQTSFEGTDLRGSTFRGAMCKGTAFAGTDIRECDFRGAILEEASFIDAKIDKTTDFRGASLINAYHNDNYDKARNLVGRGVDLRQATYDETTKFGQDPLAFPLEVNQRAIEIATGDYGPAGLKLAAFFQRWTDHLLERGEIDNDWANEQIANLSPDDHAIYEQIMDDTFRSLR